MIMKNEALIRDILIENTICLIAEGGFEKATTREIAHRHGDRSDVKINDAYIYRLFGGKEALYAEAFRRLDKELVDAFARTDLSFNGNSMRENGWVIFYSVWRFMLQNETRCRCYIRYYYSVYFDGESKKNHAAELARQVAKFSFIFKPDADVSALVHYIFTAMLSFAVRVFNGAIQDNEENTKHIYNVIYNSVSDYLVEPGSHVDEKLI